MRWDFLAFLMPGERRPVPRAAEAGVRADRERVRTALGRATTRLDGLYALLEAGDRRDAALVASLLAEDCQTAATVLGLTPPDDLIQARADLGPLPSGRELAAFARRAEAGLAKLGKALAAREARDWALPDDRFAARALFRARTVLVVGVVLVAAAILLGDTVARKRRAFVAAVRLERQRREAAENLQALARLAAKAKTATGQPLFVVTGNNCSRCGCDGRDLRAVPPGDKCVRQWETALSRIGQAAGASADSLARLSRDPWGAPYLLNENEGESPDFPCLPDTVASAGQHGLAGDGDDIVVSVPNAACPGK